MVVPPKMANQILICERLYKTVNSPIKLKVVGKATDANTKIKNIEVNFGDCEYRHFSNGSGFVSSEDNFSGIKQSNNYKPCAIICKTAPRNPSNVKVYVPAAIQREPRRIR
jgi:hypothetical protein